MNPHSRNTKPLRLSGTTAAIVVSLLVLLQEPSRAQLPAAPNGSPDIIKKSIQLPPVLERFIEAVNKGDAASFLTFFPADGIVNDWGRSFKGHDAIRRWSDGEFIGKHVTLQVTRVDRTANSFAVMTDVGGSGFNGPSKFTFIIDGDKVREMRITAN